MKRVAWAVLLVCLVCAGQAQAVMIWGVEVDSTDAPRLVTFDSATPGVATVVGPLGAAVEGYLVTGLDFDSSGNLYAAAWRSADFLYSINKSTGAATLIGGSGLATAYTIQDMSWDPANSRMLLLAIAISIGTSPKLYTVNVGSGALTELGDVSGLTDGFEVSLATDADGTVYIHGLATDRWYEVSMPGLTASALNVLPFDSNSQQGGTLDWGGDGTLYHAAWDGSLGLGQLWTINKTNGNATYVGDIGINLDFGQETLELSDIAIERNAVIPEPCTLLLLAMGLPAIRAARRRRSR